jgi:hypothetical protein
VTELDASQETAHWWPVFLPDSRHFLYFIEGGPERRGIYVGSVDSTKKTRLVASTSSAAYGMGHVLFLNERTLFAQRFNVGKLEYEGDAFPLGEPVATDGLMRARMSVSDSGVLIYDSGTRMNGRLLWTDRSGNALDTVGDEGSYFTVDLSRDGDRVAANRTDPQTGNMDIWLFDLVRGAGSRFTFQPTTDGFPVWSPDGARIAFASTRDGAVNLYERDARGAGQDNLLLKTNGNKFPTSWSPDGRRLLYHEIGPNKRSDLWVLAADRHEATVWLETEFDERNGQFSPDGQWVAYDSDESGRYEVYVRPFSQEAALGRGRWSVSTGGGERPRWRGDGRELFYLAPDRKLMAVDMRMTAGHVEAGIPKPLFPTAVASEFTAYAVTPDGQRFLIITEGQEAVSQPATVVINWTAGLKK